MISGLALRCEFVHRRAVERACLHRVIARKRRIYKARQTGEYVISEEAVQLCRGVHDLSSGAAAGGLRVYSCLASNLAGL